MQILERQLGVKEGTLQAGLEHLTTHQKIEVLERSQEGQFRLIKLTYWAIHNSF